MRTAPSEFSHYKPLTTTGGLTDYSHLEQGIRDMGSETSFGREWGRATIPEIRGSRRQSKCLFNVIFLRATTA